MATEKKRTSIWDESSEGVLKRGLNAMTRMCDVLTEQNKTLNNDIEKLQKKLNDFKINYFTMNSKRSSVGDRMVTNVVNSVCEGGGIGRHMRLKILCSSERGGSSPPPRTKIVWDLKSVVCPFIYLT